MHYYSQELIDCLFTDLGEMKIGNIVPRAGIERTSRAFQASSLTITPPRLPDVTTMPTPTCLCSSLPQRAVQTTTLVPSELEAFYCLKLDT